MCECKTKIDELTAKVALIEDEISKVGEIAVRRRDAERMAQHARDVATLALPRDELNQALIERPDLEIFLRGLGVEVVSIVLQAPAELRDKWASYLAPHWRNRVRLAMMESVPHSVWLTLTNGELRLGRVDVTPEQVAELTAVGLGDAIKYTNVHRGRWVQQADWSPPSLHTVMRTPMTAEALAVARAVAPMLDAAIESGHVRVEHFTNDEDRDSLLRQWEAEQDPRRVRGFAEVRAPW